MTKYETILKTENMTVLQEYTPIEKKNKAYQTESQLEASQIQTLSNQSYERVFIRNTQDLVGNCRTCLEELNNIKFTDEEWKRFYNNILANKNEGIIEKTNRIQNEDFIGFDLDNGSFANLMLVDKKNLHHNKLQVTNQFTQKKDGKKNRYDVTILVNGIPLVHEELKKRGVPLKQAFNQIERYSRDSFGAESGLFDYIQIFIISNGTETRYFPNTVREEIFNKKNSYKLNNSFKAITYWADAQNNAIQDLEDFTRTFMTKENLLNILTKYCVFTVDKKLLVLRPYQIAAVERCLLKMKIANTYNYFGTIDAGGYVWHSTGTGKTLTSYKLATIASKELNFINHVIFLVDRRDLDYQTCREWNSFEDGCVDMTRNTNILTRQLHGFDRKGNKKTYKIIVTTIQKLAEFMKSEPATSDVFKRKIVFVCDECHRSQFGKQHTEIIKKFKQYALFGFTGTPIFTVKASSSKTANKTTAQAFGGEPDKYGNKVKPIHTYTVLNGIADKKVVPFNVIYINTLKENLASNKKVSGIIPKSALYAHERIEIIANYILDHFDIHTMRHKHFMFSVVTNVQEVSEKQSVKPVKQSAKSTFNAMFAVDSIEEAKLFYEEFKCHDHDLKIAMIYSYGKEDENEEGFLADEDSDDTTGLTVSDREFLDLAIKDYNDMFGTAYDTSSSKFSNYYKDVSLRVKNGEIDLLIVVNMFLTGFDAPIVNTLFVDKHLHHHGLIQAFSRTNRIVGDVKEYGNIICFRNLKDEVDEAIALYGDKDAAKFVIVRPFNDYYYGYDIKNDDGTKTHVPGYKDNVDKLTSEYSGSTQYWTNEKKKEFINLFGEILREVNFLSSFIEFDGKEIIEPIDMQDYVSTYRSLYDEFKSEQSEKEDISQDIIYEAELIGQVVMDFDYILNLIEERHRNLEKAEIITPEKITTFVEANESCASKKDLVDAFIKYIDGKSPNEDYDIHKEWNNFKEENKQKELDSIITSNNLNRQIVEKYVNRIFKINNYNITEYELSKMLPFMNILTQSKERKELKEKVSEELMNFFEVYKE